MIFGGYRVGPLLKKSGREILDDGVLGLAAQTAYYFFFSLFPLLLFVAPLLPADGGNGLAMRAGMFVDALSRDHDVTLLVIPVSGGGSIASVGTKRPIRFSTHATISPLSPMRASRGVTKSRRGKREKKK